MSLSFIRIACAVLCAWVAFAPAPSFAAYGTHTAPKLLNLYLDWRIPTGDVDMLARWDVVVLDMDLQWSAPDTIRALRKKNPNIKILAYVSASEIADARGVGDKASPGYKLFSRITDDMYVHTATGTRASWWPGASLLDVTATSSLAWPATLAGFTQDTLVASRLWDGVFVDGAYGDVASFFGNDLVLRGVPSSSSSATLNAAWQDGMRALLDRLRGAVGPRGIMLVNTSRVYAPQANGILFENFSQYGWSAPFRLLLDAKMKTLVPDVSAINVNTGNAERVDDYRLLRYGLGSALVADAYFSFDAGDRGHARTWWYDEYDVPLGRPVGAAVQVADEGDGDGVWMRQYENGAVYVNSASTTHALALPGPFEHLRGAQDPKANDGSVSYFAVVPPKDSVIVLRQLDANRFARAAFRNGAEYAVFDMDGRTRRQNFIASVDGLASGAWVDVRTYDGWRERMSFVDGEVAVSSTSAGSVVFRLAGEDAAFLHHAASTTDDIVSLRRAGSSVLLDARDGNGKLRFTRTVSSARGGAALAAADLDGDGTDEIVISSGTGASARVSIWSADGKRLRTFSPFDRTMKGGITVSAGDLDGDGKNEIAVSGDKAGKPWVRIFDGAGKMKKEWEMARRLATIPRVSVADVDGDGRAEVLVRVK